MKNLVCFIAAFAMLAVFTSAQDAVNTKCPFSGDDVDAAQTVTIKKAVSFCCGNCLGKYEKDPAAMTKQVLAAESQIVNETCPISGKGTGKTVVVNGQSVGVCCGKCAKKVAGDADFEVKATKPATAKCIVTGKPAKAAKTVVAEVKVAFCCDKCVAKAEKNPAAVLSKL